MVKKKTVDRAILLQKKVGWQDGRVHVLCPGAAAVLPSGQPCAAPCGIYTMWWGRLLGAKGSQSALQPLLAALPSNANPGTWRMYLESLSGWG